MLYFGLKAADASGNTSALSNIARCQANTLKTADDTYFVSGTFNPRVTKVTFSPGYSFRPGHTQVVTLEAQDTTGNPITDVGVTFYEDNGQVTIALALIGGTADNGTWKGSRTATDTHCVTYRACD